MKKISGVALIIFTVFAFVLFGQLTVRAATDSILQGVSTDVLQDQLNTYPVLFKFGRRSNVNTPTGNSPVYYNNPTVNTVSSDVAALQNRIQFLTDQNTTLNNLIASLKKENAACYNIVNRQPNSAQNISPVVKVPAPLPPAVKTMPSAPPLAPKQNYTTPLPPLPTPPNPTPPRVCTLPTLPSACRTNSQPSSARAVIVSNGTMVGSRKGTSASLVDCDLSVVKRARIDLANRQECRGAEGKKIINYLYSLAVRVNDARAIDAAVRQAQAKAQQLALEKKQAQQRQTAAAVALERFKDISTKASDLLGHTYRTAMKTLSLTWNQCRRLETTGVAPARNRFLTIINQGNLPPNDPALDGLVGVQEELDRALEMVKNERANLKTRFDDLNTSLANAKDEPEVKALMKTIINRLKGRISNIAAICNQERNNMFKIITEAVQRSKGRSTP